MKKKIDEISISAQIYYYLKEHPNIGKFTSGKIRERLPYITQNHISSALFNLEQKGVLEFLGKDGKNIIYRIKTAGLKVKVKFASRQKYSPRRRKSGLRHPIRKKDGTVQKGQQTVQNALVKIPNEYLAEIYNIKEELFSLSLWLEALWRKGL